MIFYVHFQLDDGGICMQIDLWKFQLNWVVSEEIEKIIRCLRW